MALLNVRVERVKLWLAFWELKFGVMSCWQYLSSRKSGVQFHLSGILVNTNFLPLWQRPYSLYLGRIRFVALGLNFLICKVELKMPTAWIERIR